MITVRPGTYKDIDDICHEISPISFQEMVNCGVESAWHAKGRAKMCKDGAGLDVLFSDGKPMYALGGVYDGFTVRTWFIATAAYFKAPKSVIEASRRHVKRFADAHKKFTVESITTSESPGLRKWFKFFGFHERQKLDKCTIFHYGEDKMTWRQNSAKFPA